MDMIEAIRNVCAIKCGLSPKDKLMAIEIILNTDHRSGMGEQFDITPQKVSDAARQIANCRCDLVNMRPMVGLEPMETPA